jgi:hypothetical protein
LANDSPSRPPQQRLFLDPETTLYRALTSGKCIQGERVTDAAFRLRPANAEFPEETTLSVALTPEKAMGDLDCKGYTNILVGEVERIEGLKIQQKESGDSDLYEIAGIPLNNLTAQTDYAIALARISGRVVRVPKRAKR